MTIDEYAKQAKVRDRALIAILDGLCAIARCQFAPRNDLFAFLVAAEAVKSMLSEAVNLEENEK